MCGGSKGQSTSKTKQSQNTSWTPTGQPQLQQVYNTAQQAASQPYTPYPGQLVAGFTPEQSLAQYNINQAYGFAQPYMNMASGLFGSAAQNPNYNGLIQSFYNPMAQNVMANLNEVFGQQMADTTGKLQQAAGGIGADRIAVGQAELARQQGLAAGQTMAQLYNQAQQAAAGQQGLEQASAFGFGQLGPAAQQALMSGAQAQLGMGTLGQQTQQNLLNAQYQQYLAQQAYPFQTAQFLAGIGIPAAGSMGGTGKGTMQGTTTYTPPQPSPFSQIAGAGIAGLGAMYGSPTAVMGGMGMMGVKRGGTIKRDVGGVIPAATGDTFNISGYVPKAIQIQPGNGQQMAQQQLMPQMTPLAVNPMGAANPMTGGSQASLNNPLTLAKQAGSLGKIGDQDKQAAHDLLLDAEKMGLVDSDTAASLGSISGWDATVTPEGGYRGGAFANGGAPDYASMFLNPLFAGKDNTSGIAGALGLRPIWEQFQHPSPFSVLGMFEGVGKDNKDVGNKNVGNDDNNSTLLSPLMSLVGGATGGRFADGGAPIPPPPNSPWSWQNWGQMPPTSNGQPPWDGSGGRPWDGGGRPWHGGWYGGHEGRPWHDWGNGTPGPLPPTQLQAQPGMGGFGNKFAGVSPPWMTANTRMPLNNGQPQMPSQPQTAAIGGRFPGSYNIGAPIGWSRNKLTTPTKTTSETPQASTLALPTATTPTNGYTAQDSVFIGNQPNLPTGSGGGYGPPMGALPYMPSLPMQMPQGVGGAPQGGQAFDPSMGGTIGTIPQWMLDIQAGYPQGPSNPAVAQTPAPILPQASVATGGAISGYAVGGSPYEVSTDWLQRAHRAIDPVRVLGNTNNPGPADYLSTALTGLGAFPEFAGPSSLMALPATAAVEAFLPAQKDMTPYRNAIGHIETGGEKAPYATMAKSGALGRYQVMPSNLASWLREAGMDPKMSARDFLQSPETQDKLFDFKFGQYIDKYGSPQDAASAWFSGRPLAGNNSRDRWTGLSVPGYINKFNTALSSQSDDRVGGGGLPPQHGASGSWNLPPIQTATNTAMNMAPPNPSPGIAPVTPQQPPQAAPSPPPPPPPLPPSPAAKPPMGGAPDLEQIYLMGEKVPGMLPIRARGGLVGYDDGGTIVDPYADPIGRGPRPNHHIIQTPTTPTNVNPSVMNDAASPWAVLPGAATSDAGSDTTMAGAPMMSGAGASLQTSPFKTYDANSASLINSPTSLNNFNPGLGGVTMEMSANGADVPPGDPADEPGEPTEYGKRLQSVDEALKRISEQTKVPNLFGSPLTPGRAAMIEAGLKMMSGTSPWAAQNIGEGLSAGLGTMFETQNQYINQAQENLRARALAAQLYKPIPTSYLQNLIDPTTGETIASGSGAASGLMSDAAMEPLVEMFKQGNPNVFKMFGTGPLGNLNRNKFAEKLVEDGVDPADVSAAQLEWGYHSSQNRVLGARSGATANAIADASQLIPQARKLSASIDRTEYPTINEALQAVRYGTGDPRIKQWVGIRNDIANLVSRAATGTGAPTDLGRQMALDMLPEYGSDKQVQAALDQIEKVLGALRDGNLAAAQQIHDSFVTSHGGTATGSGPRKVMSPADYAAVPSGMTYIDPDGNVRTKP